MNNIKNLKGTLDLFNNNILIINKIIKIFKKYFNLYNFKQIETPSIENFNIINKIKKYINNPLLYKIKNNKFLIFDLTIPLIRFCITHFNEIKFPFKRYQIQKVWRGENCQKNRYREFYQCDIDIITLKSNLLEIEIINLCDDIFNNLNIKILFLINHKYILYGLCEYFKIKKKYWLFFIITIDKLEKIGKKKVKNILIKKINKYKIIKLFNFLNKNLNNIKYLLYLKNKFKNKTKYGYKGVEYLLNIFNIIKKIKYKKIKIKFKINLSRGLNYYSGIFFEIKYLNKNKNKNLLFSLGGGGKYDKIIKINNKYLYCIGISFGIYRIFNLIKKKIKIKKKKKVIILNLNNNYLLLYNKYANILRNNNIITDIYPYKENFNKQIKYSIHNKYNYLIFFYKKKKFILNKLYKKKKIIFNKIDKLIYYIKNN